MTPAELTTVRAPQAGCPEHPDRGRTIPAPRGAEPNLRVAFSPDDASPSRARLGRVAAMIADAERATPPGSRAGHPDTGVVLALLPRRPRTAVPRPRGGVDPLRTPPDAVTAGIGTAVRGT